MQLIRFERRDILRWALAVVCGGWLIGASLFVIHESANDMPLDASGKFMPYEQRLAACNDLRGSQAKYDCSSALMLGRDRSLFAKILVVLLPPLALVGAVGGVGFALRVRRDRETQRRAREAYAAQMEDYRAKRAAEEAEIAAGVRKEELFLDDEGNLVEPPSRFARWKEQA